MPVGQNACNLGYAQTRTAGLPLKFLHMTQIKNDALFYITLFKSQFKYAKTLNSHVREISTPSVAIMRTTDFHRGLRRVSFGGDISLYLFLHGYNKQFSMTIIEHKGHD